MGFYDPLPFEKESLIHVYGGRESKGRQPAPLSARMCRTGAAFDERVEGLRSGIEVVYHEAVVLLETGRWLCLVCGERAT